LLFYPGRHTSPWHCKNSVETSINFLFIS